VHGNPLTFVILLNLNALVSDTAESFELFDELSVIFCSRVINAAFDDGTGDSEELEPPDYHDNKHDQIEEGKLEDD